MSQRSRTPKKNQSNSIPSKPLSTPAKKSKNGNEMWVKRGPLIFLGFVSIIILQARIRLLAIPLERDEGSFAYIGHWLLRGKALYTDMLDSKLPGLYTMYSLFITLFGYDATGVHLGLFFANIAAGVFFYFLLRDLFNSFVASISTSFLLILTLSPNVVGFAAHATQLLLPFLLAGCWLFWKGIKTGKIRLFFLAGILIGLAFTIKQQAALFGVMLALIWWPIRMVWDKKEDLPLPIREWVMMGVGGFIPVALTIGYFAMTGRLHDFIFWTLTQPITLSEAVSDPMHKLLWDGLISVSSKFEIVWIAGITGLVLIFYSGIKIERVWFSVLFAVCGFVSIVIGVGYYIHYFVLFMPGIALGVGVTVYWISTKTDRYSPLIGFALAFILIMFPLTAESDYYFRPDYIQIHQQAYHENMFPEIELIGKELARRVPEKSKIAVLGSEPELLVAADREGCSKYLMVYSLFVDPVNSPNMQDEYFSEITTCDADYLVYDVFSSSWTNGYEDMPLHQKNDEWVKANFVLEGVAEYRPGLPGVIVWGDEARHYKPKTTYMVYIFKRK